MLKFSKLHGNGNDYVFMEEITGKLPELSNLAVRVSNRNFGIGADGLIVASPSQIADFRMLMFNADGTKGKMCGNGIRALAKYAFEKGLVQKKEMKIETDSGIKSILLSYDREDSTLAYASVDMGKPVFEPSLIPFVSDACEGAVYQAPFLQQTVGIHAISMGNPHSVTFLSNMREELKVGLMMDDMTHCSLEAFQDTKKLGRLNYFDIERFGTHIQGLDCFPEGVNVEIAEVIDRSNIAMRVYERGSGETLSCGTGCCAVAAVAIKKNLTNPTVNVHTLGGSLEIIWNNDSSSSVIMKGPARTVFEGELMI